ncbi:MAG: tyrosine--tRNA ligase [Rickettsiales bacterium]|jgi:tyrosyl-tRNA synthetase|nr:tyrosine--tRNA ligase [Rickettsiales bacterium]
MKNDFLHELEQRGMMFQASDLDGLADWLNGGGRTGYLGVDPTADSFHVGHLVPVMIMRWFQRYGHRPIMLVGGATGRIGDPSGRDTSRLLLTEDDVDKNRAGLRKCYEQFIRFGNGASDAIMVDNYDWHKNFSHLDFLREFGTSFTIPKMLAMESVKKRLENDMSFLEFNYMPLQAVDFLELFDEYDCRLQLCGADQWGNSVAGISLIRRKRQAESFVLSTPLITDSSGNKIGKTAGNAVWVGADKLSPFDYYQYFRNIPDDLVEKFLKIFTELPMDEIARLAGLRDAELNEAKKILAFEAAKIAHGERAAADAADAAASLFGGGAADGNIPSMKIKAELPMPALDFAMLTGLFSSKSEARRAIGQGGLSIGGLRVAGAEAVVLPARELLVQKGKKTFLKVIVK